VRVIVTVGSLWICACALAAELHPIVEVESGYFFGATTGGKWIKAAPAGKSVTSGTTYRIYSLTEQLEET